ncbi:YajD family HNH nuclease [Candidatus Thiosymbion oneisti]|uniref:YajD family HNH nuclease n=1 Tax=Candidatus Thiosymbion oneisti TaxID=589554 RepID=UPI000AFA73AB|nr:YajD family HNH nuclease [Candidatus Thiosymbion oneisti]
MSKPTPPDRPQTGKTIDTDRLDRVVVAARRARDEREQGYREQALKLYPWVCGRCGRTFNHANLRELTVHHRDHNHDNNPSDGSNWELLCLYCHDNEHQRYEEHIAASSKGAGQEASSQTTHRPFEGLEALLKRGK